MSKDLKNAKDFVEYLEKINFQKHLNRLENILKDKKIVLYGAGLFFQTLADNYDLSKLNIIAISDRKFINHEENETFCGYKVCAPDEIKTLNADMLLMSMLYYVQVIWYLEFIVLKNCKTQIKPLINKPFMEVWKEIWK